MAKSSALSTSNEYIKYTIEIIQNSQNIANNTSNVTVKVRFYRTNTGYETYGSGTVYCKINGTKYSASVTSSQKITSSGIVLFTKTLNITHGTDGTKKLTCSAWIDHSRVTSDEQSYSLTLTTIPRKSTLSVANGTLGTPQTLAVTRQSTSFTHSIKAVCGSSTLYIKADGTTSTSEVKHSDCSIPFTPPLAWASQNTAGDEVTVKYTITTYNGSTSIGTNAYTKTYAIPTSVVPSLSVVISEATVLQWGVYVQSVSKLKIVITPTLAYSSPIASYRATIDGKTYTSKDFETEILKTSGTLTVTVTITDKRGRKATYSEDIEVLPYTPPSITNLTVTRCNNDSNYTSNPNGAYAKVSYSYKFASLNCQNELAIDTQYKKKSESNYTLLNTTGYAAATEGTVTKVFPAATTASYDVQIVATDAIQELFGNPSTKALEYLGTIGKFLSFFKQIGLGIGKVFDTTRSNLVDIGWDVNMNENNIEKATILPTVLTVATAGETDAGLQAIYSAMDLETCKVVCIKQSIQDGLPVGGTWFATIYKTNDNYGVITAVRHNNGASNTYQYKRTLYAGVWGNWVKQVDESDIADSGWIYPTLGENFNHYTSTHHTRYRKVGKQVFAQGEFTPASTFAADSTQRIVFTFPEKYRPSDRVYTMCHATGKRHFLLAVTPDGNVWHGRYGSQGQYAEATAGTWFPFYITFFVD